MATTALEGSNLSPPIVIAAPEVTIEARSERRQEFEKMLPQGLPRFRTIPTRWLGNPEDAEDAVQDAMLSAFKHITSFNGRAKMSTWLVAIVINAVRMQMRRRRRGRMLSLDYSPEEGQPAISERLADPRPTPEKILERFEFYALVIKLTCGLAPSQRAALRLYQQNGQSIRKLATKLGVPEGTLKAQLARGRAKLKDRFHEVVDKRKVRESVTEEASGMPEPRRYASCTTIVSDLTCPVGRDRLSTAYQGRLER